MEMNLVETERVGRVLVITLNRPKVNAINRALSRAIHAAAEELQRDDALRVGLIAAKGDRVFSAGWDFMEATHGGGGGDGESDGGHGAGGFAGITQFWDLRKPLVAAVNGAAIGGGFEIALATDVIVMADHAYFELPEMQRGILPDAGGIQRLPRRVPYNVAMEMMLSGRRMSATEAVAWGLAHKAVPAATLRDEALALATRIAEGAPLALQALKEVMQAIDCMPLPEAMAVMQSNRDDLQICRRMWASEDAIEGPRAFLERRPPVWQGR